jgi:hypothetical protein
MSNFQKHLYCLIYPNSALVASELDPKAFGRHYAISYPKNYKGKVVFVEVDINFRNDYFLIDEKLAECYHDDGRPKKTKFISSYRILEHIDIEAFQDMYLITTGGKALKLNKQEGEYHIPHQEEKIRVFQLMSPLYYLIATSYTPPEFGKFLANDRTKGVPKSAMIQIDIDPDSIIDTSGREILYSSPLPGVHPGYLRAAFLELKRKGPDKRTKTISLKSIFDNIPFIKIRHGIWINEKDKRIYYPMPSITELEESHYYWLKEATVN